MNQLSKRVDAWLLWSIPIPVVFALIAVAPASATDTVVAHLQEPSSIRTFAGIEVFSAFEGTPLQGGIYRLAILRDDKFELLPVAPSQAPFEADIGPDRNGQPKLVYTRCTSRDPSTGRTSGCDLFTRPLVSSAGEQPVNAANTSRDEGAPTLWNGRIAFARQSKDGSAVYTRRLGDPRSHHSERLPGIPFAARFHGTRVRIKRGKMAELELHGDRLAEIITKPESASVVRIVRISTHRSRLVTRVGVGEAGQHLAGVGFASGYLAWAFGGAIGKNAGIYRYRLSTGELSHASFPPVVDYDVAGLALFAANGAYITDAQPDVGGCGGDQEAIPPVVRLCQIIRSQPLRFRRTGSRRLRARGWRAGLTRPSPAPREGVAGARR
jgi:hypothetical protein